MLMSMDASGTTFTPPDFSLLLIRRSFPERTDGESHVIRAFLLEHLRDYTSITFNKRVGKGLDPDPTHLEAVQQNTRFSSQLRIDILGWRGPQPVIVEVKQRVTPASLGQILTYQHHFVEENPDAPIPDLVVVGREAIPDAVVALQAHGVTVYLYPDANAVRDAGVHDG